MFGTNSNLFALQNDNAENFKKLTDAINGSKGGKTLGVFAKDSFPGEFCEAWKAVLKTNKYENADISAAIAYVMGPKEDSEITTMKKACTAAVDVFGKYLRDNIMDIIDSDKVTFNWLAN